ncbi:MAG TPA: GNAT family N-acetyltransferase [Candidatus Sulfotelmatobacter sp.]|nr:GNAT family N-acetyltransferase [Candidatus Sulfotelmatobacter sp.]
MNYQITALNPEDWAEVRKIYREGIATGNATFETELPDWEKWDRAHRPDCRLVAREPVNQEPERAVLGFAALSAVSARRVYKGVAEVSVYMAESARGRGIGKALLQALVNESELHGIWTLQAGIFPENVASLALHKSCGFREVGIRRRIGKLGETWRDVLLLERRSSVAGS